METLVWSDVEIAAQDAFNIWVSSSDLEWAKDAWGRIAQAGYCSYGTERERHLVIGRFLALASIYRDWCSVAFDETHDDMPGEWIADLNVEGIYLGQLFSEEDLSDDPDEAFQEGLTFLIDLERPTVVRALREAYGGTEADLFVALWRSVRSFTSLGSGDEDFTQEEYSEILNDPTQEKLAGYGWVEEGCPRIR